MGRFKKIGIALLVVFFVVISFAAIATWYLFTPEKLTPIVNKQAKGYVTCKLTIDRVEPTFFSSYPFFGIEINNLCLSDENKSSKADTIVFASKCYASFNLKAYLFDNDIKFDPLAIENGFINYKIDAENRSNFDIMKSTTSSSDSSEAFSLGNIDLSNINLKDININYTDDYSLRKASLKNLNSEISVHYSKENQTVNLDMHLNSMLFNTSDSLAIDVEANDCDIRFTAKGKDKNNYKSLLSFSSEELSLAYLGDSLISKMRYETSLPFNLNLADKSTSFKDAYQKLNEYSVFLNGKLKLRENNDIETDISYSTNRWDVEKLLKLVPRAYAAQIKDLRSKGYTELSGDVKGLISENSLPVVDVNVDYSKGEVKYASYPRLRNIKMRMSTKIDMNKNMQSSLIINDAYAKVLNSSLNLKGNISDILGSPAYDIKAKGKFTFADFQDYIPKEQNVIIKGSSLADVHIKFNQSAIDKEEYHRIYLLGKFNTKNLYAIYNDTTELDMTNANIWLTLPSHRTLDRNQVFANVKLNAEDFNINMSPEMSAKTHNIKISADINNMLKGASSPITSCDFDLENLHLRYDTLNVKAKNSLAKLFYDPALKGTKTVADIITDIKSKHITVTSRDSVLFDVKDIAGSTKLAYNEAEKNIIKRWNPTVEMKFYDGVYNLGEKLKGSIPNIYFTLNPQEMEIKKAKLIIGNSDFSLTGRLNDITKYIKNESLLKGKFNLVSNKIDVYELMDIFNGMGRDDSAVDSKRAKVSEVSKTEDNPFMVPKGVDIRLETKIDQTIVNDNVIEDIKGALTVKDGTLILDQMGFTSKAANMQLTAMYKSKRRNHLFSSVDFHLLNIDIAELIDIIPYVDTMVPMLKSFKGSGEFHLAGEAYLKSDYQLKKSTIRGAAAFEGQNLTIMDNDTFSMIAKKLLFKKKTKNVIDSLSAEMTLFKDEIDIYPFLIVMDDYKAVLSGRHNTDNSFNYHISVTDCPLPIRLGLNISGTIDDLDYKLSKCKYKHLYNPKRQGAIEKQTLRLKKLISTSLKKNVKPIVEKDSKK